MEVNDNNKLLVTVITPLYNAQDYIAETIESVIKQSYQNFEMLIIDDCSTDSSRDIVRKYEEQDSRVRLIESEFNFGGPARPRNIGLDNAKGDYVAFLDADDVWLPEKLKKQVSFLEKNMTVNICHTLAEVIDENSINKGKIRKSKLYDVLSILLNKRNILYYINYININSTLMRIDKKIKFDEDKNIIAVEDWKYWIDNQNNGKAIKYFNEVLLNYRVHDSSISNRKSDIGYRKSIYMLTMLLLKKEISLLHYFLSSVFHILKILKK